MGVLNSKVFHFEVCVQLLKLMLPNIQPVNGHTKLDEHVASPFDANKMFQ